MACIEGIVYGLKRLILELTPREIHSFIPEQRAMLKEEQYDLNEKGEAIKKPAKLRLAPNLLFAFNTFAKMMGKPALVVKDSCEWSEFQSVVRMRDRLMHPKNAKALMISEHELFLANRTYNWFHNQFARMFKTREAGPVKLVEFTPQPR
jgi:hypothetical protein